MKQVFADTLYWVASMTPGDPWHAPTLRAVAVLGPAHVVTTEEVLVEFLSAYAGRGEYLRHKAMQTVRAILTKHPPLSQIKLSPASLSSWRESKAFEGV
jgi:uncharacterized protein